MEPLESLLVFTPPSNSKKGADCEYYWPDGQLVRTYAYSKQDNGTWIVGYHTIGSRKCEQGLTFISEQFARMKWIGSPSSLKQYS